MMVCDCDTFDENPGLRVDEAVAVCECGHTDDEHNESGECEAEL